MPQIIIRKTVEIQGKLVLDARESVKKPDGRGYPEFYQFFSKSQNILLLPPKLKKSLFINALCRFLVCRQSMPKTEERCLEADFLHILTKICGIFVE